MKNIWKMNVLHGMTGVWMHRWTAGTVKTGWAGAEKAEKSFLRKRYASFVYKN
jgi:hypothetical protein